MLPLAVYSVHVWSRRLNTSVTFAGQVFWKLRCSSVKCTIISHNITSQQQLGSLRSHPNQKTCFTKYSWRLCEASAVWSQMSIFWSYKGILLEKTVTFEDTQLICLTQTAEASNQLWLDVRKHVCMEQSLWILTGIGLGSFSTNVSSCCITSCWWGWNVQKNNYFSSQNNLSAYFRLGSEKVSGLNHDLMTGQEKAWFGKERQAELLLPHLLATGWLDSWTNDSTLKAKPRHLCFSAPEPWNKCRQICLLLLSMQCNKKSSKTALKAWTQSMTALTSFEHNIAINNKRRVSPPLIIHLWCLLVYVCWHYSHSLYSKALLIEAICSTATA